MGDLRCWQEATDDGREVRRTRAEFTLRMPADANSAGLCVPVHSSNPGGRSSNTRGLKNALFSSMESAWRTACTLGMG